jgi:hypothetical protein
MESFSPFDDDVLLKGTLIVLAVGRRDRQPLHGRTVVVRACGFV